jgi:osmotically inducible protein OsmC
MTAIYQTSATAQGGRTGRASTTDGRLTVELSLPRELGGPGGPGTNPEQLFAAGYAACFETALRLVARRDGIALPEGTTITAEVGLARTEAGLYQLTAALVGVLPGLPADTARALMQAAHRVCPYSNATRGNVEVTLRLAEDTAPARAQGEMITANVASA